MSEKLREVRRWMEFEQAVSEALNRSSIDTELNMPDFLAAGLVTAFIRNLVTYRGLERQWRAPAPQEPKPE